MQQQTALDWFIENMIDEGYIDKYQINEHFSLFRLLAKKMQQKQIEAAYNRGAWDGAKAVYDPSTIFDSEDYYKTTYK